MENEASAILLTFLNILADELQIEELESIEEASNFVPILTQLIKSGELIFVFNPLDEKFSNAHEYLKSTLGNNFVEHLNAENADKSDRIEIANMLLALIFALKLLQERKFYEICNRLDPINNYCITNMIEQLDNSWNLNRQSPIPFLTILKSCTGSSTDLVKKNSMSGTIQIFSSSDAIDQELIPADEDTTIYKVRAVELETKLKQIDALNSKLNEQLGVTQTEYNDLENKHENLKHAQALNQETIDQLQTQLKEMADEAETIRYQNSQLQRDVKNANERLSRETQKSAAELKSRDEENKLLYMRLDELVKQLAEKESGENKARFLEQQMANQREIIKELRDNLEGAIERANIAETELRRQAKHENTFFSGNNESGNISQNTENAISLHDELNSTYQTAISQNGFNNSHENHNINMNGDEISELRTRLEVIQCENRQLKKTNEEYKNKFEEIQKAETKTILEKAKEIERLKQECESFRNEVQKRSRKEASAMDKAKDFEEKNIRLEETVAKLEESLDKAAKVIEEYSNASGDDHCSAAELLQLRHELERVQTENQRLLAKMDQFKHEATQEQRLITQHWYQSQLNLLGVNHGLGLNSPTPSSSMRSSLVDNLRSATPNNNPQHHSSLISGVDDYSQRRLSQQPTSSANSQQKSLHRRLHATTNSSLPLRLIYTSISIFILLFLLQFAEFSLMIDFGYE